MDAALRRAWDAARRLFASGAGENVVKGAAQQTNDDVELLITDGHLAGKIAFDGQRRLMIALARSAGEGNIAPNRPGR